MISLCYHSFANFSSKLDILSENIDYIIAHLGYEAIDYKTYGVILIEKNPAATAVAEILDSQTALDIMRYNHHALKGDIIEKRRLLIGFADKFEPIRKKLKGTNPKLESDIGYLLNNVNIRHNNIDYGKNYKKFVADMPSETLEYWYDETYQALLLAFLEVDHLDRSDKIQDLKRNIDSSD